MSLNIEHLCKYTMSTPEINPISVNTMAVGPTSHTGGAPNQAFIGQTGQSAQDVVQFITQGEVPEVALTDNANAEEQYFVSADTAPHEISDIMSRPWRVSSGKFSSGMADGQIVENFDVTKVLRTCPAYDKLRGFLAFTATFCFRLVTNSQPTQSGAAMMVFLQSERTSDEANYGFWNDSTDPWRVVPRLSANPNVMHVLGAASQSELRVAYRATTPLCDVAVGAFGSLQVRSVSPIRGPTDAENVPYTLYVWLEDLKTYGVQPNARTVFDESKVVLATAQSKGQTSVAEASKKSGPISDFAGSVAGIAGALSTIPLVGDIAGPVSWVASGVASIASLFGFSKPHDITPSMPFTINPFKDFAHGSGVNACETKLTLNDLQEQKISALGATEKDEMNIKYITSIPTLIKKLVWTTGSGVTDILGTYPVAPHALYSQRFQTARGLATVHSTLSYLAMMHKYWRGRIDFTLTIVGTRFHSGRLRLVYRGQQSGEEQQTQFTYSTLWDIQESTTHTFTCPWVSELPYRTCWPEPEYLDYNDGMFTIIVEDPLVCNETCNEGIEILVWVSGDVKYACPVMRPDRNMNGLMLEEGIPPAKLKEVEEVILPDDIIYADQQNKNDVTATTDTCDMVPTDKAPTPQQEICALESTIGEPEPSLRMLVKRMAFFSEFQLTDKNATRRDYPFLLTHALSGDYRSVPGLNALDRGTSGDWVDRVAAMYRFRTGSMRFCVYGYLPGQATYASMKFCPRSAASDKMDVWKVSPQSTAYHWGTPREFNELASYLEIPYADTSKALQVLVPYYHKLPVIANERFLPNTTGNVQFKARDLAAPKFTTGDYILLNNTEPNDAVFTGKQLSVFRAAGDDFNCGYFTGPPVTYVPDETLA